MIFCNDVIYAHAGPKLVDEGLERACVRAEVQEAGLLNLAHTKPTHALCIETNLFFAILEYSWTLLCRPKLMLISP